MYLIDTNILSFLIKGNDKVIAKFGSVNPDLIFVSSIVWAEIMFGLLTMQKSKKQELLISYFEGAKENMNFVSFDEKCSEVFAVNKKYLQKSGTNIEDFDIMIASTAVVNELILVTNNTKHFMNIPNLKLGDWSL